jgi:hypothetical protein
MSLLSVDITKVKRLSFLGVNKPAPQSLPKDTAPSEPRTTPTLDKIDVPRLISLAQGLITGEDNYTKEEVIARLISETKVDQDRAERGFNLMLQAGALETTPASTYYLAGSTPF